jgi:hypothetical protein
VNTTTRQEGEAVTPVKAHPRMRERARAARAASPGDRAPGGASTDSRARSRRSTGSESAGATANTPSVWREPLLALLDYAELEILEYPDERERVDAVRRALSARFERQPMTGLDLRDAAFTLGLVSTAMGSELSSHGLLSQCLRTLSPSAFAEYERAKGFVRISPPFRC